MFMAPGSISLPQKLHGRVIGISLHAQLPRLARRLPQHEDVPHLDRAAHVPCDDPALVLPVEDAHLDLRRLARHPRAADDLDDLGGDVLVLLRHRLTSLSALVSPPALPSPASP